MKSSKKCKKEVDDISKETQRLVKDSHVCLPYHKPKQKSLKDFLNRQKITTEFQVSITGSKKLLQKAWELIENKEQNVEKFYNENCSEENTENSTYDDIQAKNVSLINDDDGNNDFDKGKHTSKELSDSQKNYDSDSDEETKLLTNYDDDENSSHSKATSSSEETHLKQLDNEDSENDFDLNYFEDDKSNFKGSIANQFIDDEAESSELDCISDEEKSLSSVDESEDEEDISTKKKRRVVLLSESSDEEDLNSDINLKPDDLIPISNEPERNMSTQQLMDLCSGQFQTQLSDAQEENDLEFEDDFDSDVPLNDIDNNRNENDSVTPAKNLQNDFEPDILQNDDESSNYGDELKRLKLTSVKDFFDDEAELSESDWSSDDEDHLLDNINTLEAEAGDKDKLDEDVVKDGLDKIYMRQLLDDDNHQVTALQEMLLKDGDLHSDSARKRKFQWDQIDENDTAFKKPLFSDDEDEHDDVLSDDEKSIQWRKERFKRESFLSQKSNSDNEEDINDNQKSSDGIPLVSAVKKTHVVKYGKNTSSKNLTSVVHFVQSNNIIETNKIKADVITPNLNKIVKGSFMKQNNDKMTTALLYINKKSVINNESENCKQNNEVKSMTTITSKVSSNPFVYLLRNAKPANENLTSDDSINIIKKENVSLNKPCINVPTTQKFHQHKSNTSITSILKHLE